MEKETQYTLVEFPEKDLKSFNEDLQKLVDKYSGHLSAIPRLNTDGTLGASMVMHKKVELILKDDAETEKQKK